MKKIQKLNVVLLLVAILMSTLTIKTQAATVQTNDVTFNAEYYLNTYADLKDLFGDDYNAAYNHFINFGINEGRVGSPYFDVKYYLNNNADLKSAFGNDYAAAYNHFLSFGMNEGRVGSSFFDVKYYLNSYADLKAAFGNNYAAAYNHYMTSGISEGRNPNASLNVNCYLQNNADLKNAFGTDYKLVAKHYYTYGVNEDRVCNHTYTKTVTKNATCDNAGSVAYTCKCGDSYTTTIPATGHSYTNVLAVNATCTEAGHTAGVTCTKCGYTTVENLDATNHNLVNVAAQEPTCTTAGHTAGVTCTKCGYTTVTTLPASGHNVANTTNNITWNWNAAGDTCTTATISQCIYCLESNIIVPATTTTEVVREATCTSAGIVKYTATLELNGTTVEDTKTVTVSALGHDDVGVVVPAVEKTCTTDGLTEGLKCSRCDYMIVPQRTVPASHDEVYDYPVAATCTKPGLTEGVHCANCDYVRVPQQVVLATGHDLKNVMPVWDDENEDYTKCKIKINCNTCEIFYEEVETTKNVIAEPTCTAAGRTQYIAKISIPTTNGVINREYTKNVRPSALGHDPVLVPAKAATCAEAGYTEHTECSRCGLLEYYAEIPAINHANHWAVIEAKAPTCTETGTDNTGRYCTECGEILVDPHEITATGHAIDNFSAEWSADHKTCTMNYTCRNCGEFSVVVNSTVAETPATCTTAGYKVYTAKSRVPNDIERTETYTEYTNGALGHATAGGVTIKDATCTEDGEVSAVYCTRCNQVVTASQTLPKTGHKVASVDDIKMYKHPNDATGRTVLVYIRCTEHPDELVYYTKINGVTSTDGTTRVTINGITYTQTIMR